MTRVYNLMLIGYIAAMIYVITEPWHDEIGEAIVDSTINARTVWNRGRFYLEAKVDTIILTEGYVNSHG
jgi:tRNA G37 N-methylase Trm5